MVPLIITGNKARSGLFQQPTVRGWFRSAGSDRHGSKALEERRFSSGQEYLEKSAVVSRGFLGAFHKHGDTHKLSYGSKREKLLESAVTSRFSKTRL